MQRRRSIRTTNEGRSIEVKPEQAQQPAPAPAAQPSNPLADQIGKGIVDQLTQVVPKAKTMGQSLQELVEKAQKEALGNYQIGKGISKSWVDSQYGGISEEAWKKYVAKFQQAMLGGPAAAQPSVMLKPYSGQNYPQQTQISAPPGYEPHAYEPQVFKDGPPPGANPHPGLGWTPQKASSFCGDVLKKIKVVVDPTIPADVMVMQGADGKPVLIQLQKEDAEALKQHFNK